MGKEYDFSAADAVRMLTSVCYDINYLELTGEGHSSLGKTPGELMLVDALRYLAFGDTELARAYMDQYDEWKQTGYTPWPYNGGKPPHHSN